MTKHCYIRAWKAIRNAEVVEAHNREKYIRSTFRVLYEQKIEIMSDALDLAKNIGVSVVGSIAGNKAADALHLGGAGHIAGGVAGSVLANDVEQKEENKN